MNFTNIFLFVFHWVLKSALEIEEVQNWFFPSFNGENNLKGSGRLQKTQHIRWWLRWGDSKNMNKLSHTHLCTSVTNGVSMGDLQEDRSGENVLTPCTVTCCSIEAIPNSPWHGSWAKSNSASKSSPSLTWALHLTQLVTPWSPCFSCWSPCHWLLLSLCHWPLHFSEFCIQSTLHLHPQTPSLLYLSSFSRTSIRLMALKTSLMLVAPKFETVAWNVPLKSRLSQLSTQHFQLMSNRTSNQIFPKQNC